MTQGSLVTTDNSLDLAIEGGGFFQVLLPDGRVGQHARREGGLGRTHHLQLRDPANYQW